MESAVTVAAQTLLTYYDELMATDFAECVKQFHDLTSAAAKEPPPATNERVGGSEEGGGNMVTVSE